MYDYVVKELPKLLSDNFPELETSKASIFGHSMGGHGALTIYLKNLDKYKVLVIMILSTFHFHMKEFFFENIGNVLKIIIDITVQIADYLLLAAFSMILHINTNRLLFFVFL